MAYIAETDIKKRLTERRINALTSDSGLSYSGNIVADCIAEATAEIHSYLNGTVKLPLTEPVPDIIKIIATDIAIFYLYLRRAEGEVPEHIQKMYDLRKADLERLRNTDFLLRSEEIRNASDVPNVAIVTKKKRVFDENFYKGY